MAVAMIEGKAPSTALGAAPSTALGAAPSTALCAVPLPRGAGEDWRDERE
jgi:hypothetical protein